MIVSTRLDTQIEESFQSSDIFFEKIKEMDVNHTNDIGMKPQYSRPSILQPISCPRISSVILLIIYTKWRRKKGLNRNIGSPAKVGGAKQKV